MSQYGLLSAKFFCFADGETCRFKYAKQFTEQGETTGKSVRYRRPNNGRRLMDKRTNKMIDDRNIVPHNRYLLERYDCHCNAESSTVPALPWTYGKLPSFLVFLTR